MPDRKIVAFDPGEIHVGVAMLSGHRNGSWNIVEVWEVNPHQALQMLEPPYRPDMGEITFVIEEWRLYPNKTKEMVGSDFPTAQLIGQMKYLIARADRPVVMQPAAIKKPTEALMKVRGIQHEAVRQGRGGHAKDAETHAWHYVLRYLMKEDNAQSSESPGN